MEKRNPGRMSDNPAGRKEEITTQAKVPPQHQSGVWSHDPGPVARPNVHEITRVDEQTDAVRIHVELPPVDPKEVLVDATSDEITVITPQGQSTDIYCTIDVPPNVDVTRMSTSITRGHLEIVLPRAGIV